jgi:hypothetical protein
MRLSIACALLVGAALPASIPTAHAANVPPAIARSTDVVIGVQARAQRRQRDCTPYNGPFGFYGNIWCQPPNKESYLRNLGSPWPMNTPPSLRKAKPSSNTDW